MFLSLISSILNFVIFPSHSVIQSWSCIWSIDRFKISWIIILYAEHAWVIIGARFLAGLTGGGVFICIPLFVAEIANDRWDRHMPNVWTQQIIIKLICSVRGQLSSLLQLNFNAGIVLGYVTGGYLSYFTVPLVLIAVPIVFFAIFMWLPHSPQYLLKNGQNEVQHCCDCHVKNKKNIRNKNDFSCICRKRKNHYGTIAISRAVRAQKMSYNCVRSWRSSYRSPSRMRKCHQCESKISVSTPGNWNSNCSFEHSKNSEHSDQVWYFIVINPNTNRII